MFKSNYDEIKDIINGVNDENEMILALGNTIKILAQGMDNALKEISELKHELENIKQYIDEEFKQSGCG